MKFYWIQDQQNHKNSENHSRSNQKRKPEKILLLKKTALKIGNSHLRQKNYTQDTVDFEREKNTHSREMSFSINNINQKMSLKTKEPYSRQKKLHSGQETTLKLQKMALKDGKNDIQDRENVTLDRKRHIHFPARNIQEAQFAFKILMIH